MLNLCVKELVDRVGGRLSMGDMPPLAGDATPLGRVVIDSRVVEPGDVFWALPGLKCDGADYANDAMARGAAGVVVAGRHVEPWAGCWTLEVHDTHWALWQLAAMMRYRFDGRVIAVTGSVGKTTTRQMIHAVLGSRLQGTASPRNFNNHIGVPLSMLAWNEEDDYGVLEMGASGRGEIDSLCGLSAPSIGVITCIGEAHLGGFGSRQAIAESKAELLSALPRDGWAVLHGDDPWLRRMALHCRARIVWVGRSAECDLVATNVRSNQGEILFETGGCQFHVPVWGRHYLVSALAAVAVGQIMELPNDDIAAALEQFAAPPQRCQVSQVRGITIINDTYNSSPTAMRAALELLRDFDTPGRRIVVCGDMRELGETAVDWHRLLGSQVVTVAGADVLVACGQHAREVVTGARDAGMPLGKAVACRTTQDAVPVLGYQVAPGDVLLIKGSRALAMEQLVEAIGMPRWKQAA